MRSPNPVNLEMLRHVAQRLNALRDAVVFVGGAVVDLLITDSSAPHVRSTKDVDVIVEVASAYDYHKLGERLRALGFREDSQSEGGPVCRSSRDRRLARDCGGTYDSPDFRPLFLGDKT